MPKLPTTSAPTTTLHVRSLLSDASCLLTGVLLCLASTAWNWPLAAWIALIPLARAIDAPRSSRAMYVGAYLAGVLLGLSGFSWIRTCYGGHALSGPYAVAWLAIGQFGGVVFLATLWFGRRFRTALGGPAMRWLPLLWVTQECLREFAVMAIDQSGGPWLRLGQSQAGCLTMAQCADLGGEFGLTALVAAVNGALYDAVVRRGVPWQRRLSGLATATLVVSVAGLYGAWRLEQPLAISGSLNAQSPVDASPVIALAGEQDLPPLPLSVRLADDANPRPGVGRRPDLIVWPELAFQHEANAGLTHLAAAARELDAAIVMGCVRQDPTHLNRRFNSALCVDSDGACQGVYDKRQLVPWTEFMPFGELLPPMAASSAYAPGASSPVFELAVPTQPRTKVRFACAICYDIAFAELIRSSMCGRSADADFLVAIGSECQDRSGILAEAMLQATRLRAIELRRPIVRNAAGGFSGIVDSCGRLTGPAPGDVETRPVILPPLPLDRRCSLYAQVGDVWAWMVAASVCTIALGKSPAAMFVRPRAWLPRWVRSDAVSAT